MNDVPDFIESLSQANNFDEATYKAKYCDNFWENILKFLLSICNHVENQYLLIETNNLQLIIQKISSFLSYNLLNYSSETDLVFADEFFSISFHMCTDVDIKKMNTSIFFDLIEKLEESKMSIFKNSICNFTILHFLNSNHYLYTLDLEKFTYRDILPLHLEGTEIFKNESQIDQFEMMLDWIPEHYTTFSAQKFNFLLQFLVFPFYFNKLNDLNTLQIHTDLSDNLGEQIHEIIINFFKKLIDEKFNNDYIQINTAIVRILNLVLTIDTQEIVNDTFQILKNISSNKTMILNLENANLIGEIANLVVELMKYHKNTRYFNDICNNLISNVKNEENIIDFAIKSTEHVKSMKILVCNLFSANFSKKSWEIFVNNENFLNILTNYISDIDGNSHFNEKYIKFENFESNIQSIVEILGQNDQSTEVNRIIKSFDFFRVNIKYKYLTKFVIKTPDQLTGSIAIDLENYRTNIIVKHRKSIMMPMLENFNSFESHFKDISQLESFVLRPEDIAPPNISPQLIQQASHLLTTIHFKINLFASAIFEMTKIYDFDFLCSSSIPSLFGYFTSPEHLQLAFSFYTNVLSNAPKKMRPKLLIPFFMSPVIFPFIESIYKPFFDKLLRDDRYSKQNQRKELVDYYALFLQSLIEKSSYSLHQCHSVLLKFMYNQWPLNATLQFILNMFLKNHAMNWLKCEGYSSRKQFVEDIFQRIIESKDIYTSILNKICNATSLFEVPDMYTIFDQPYMVFYSSFADLSAIAKVIKTKLEYSTLSCFLQPPEGLNVNAMFWFKIFPKRPLPKPFIQRQMVFNFEPEKIDQQPDKERMFLQLEQTANSKEMSTIEFMKSDKFKKIISKLGDDFEEFAFKNAINKLIAQGNSFETFLKYKMYLNLIENWSTVANDYETLFTVPYADKYTKKLIEDLKKEKLILKKIFSVFDTRPSQQSAFFAVVEHKMADITKNNLPTIKKLSELFKQRLNNPEEDDLNPMLTTVVGNKLYATAVENLHLINGEKLCKTFTLIIKVAKILSKAMEIENTKINLFNCAMHMKIIPDLPFYYIILKELVVKNQKFITFIDEEEQRCWILFEQAILKLVVKDQKIFDIFFPFQEIIGEK